MNSNIAQSIQGSQVRDPIFQANRSLSISVYFTVIESLFGWISVPCIDLQNLQFFLGSAHILKQPLFRQACAGIFNVCDQESRGFISKQQVTLPSILVLGGCSILLQLLIF